MKTCGKCGKRKQCREFGIYGQLSNYAEKCKKFEEELKPCPFCGAKAISGSDIPAKGLNAIVCGNTECLVKPFVVSKTMQEATERWNTRKPR